MIEIDPARIDQDRYLRSSLAFTPREAALRDNLMSYIPTDVIDSHSHTALPEHVLTLDQRILHHMMSTFPYFSLEDSYRTKETFFPGKNVRSLRFAQAFGGIDHKAVNDYLLDTLSSSDRMGLYGIPTDPEYTIKMLENPSISALKMYPAFFTPPVSKIYDYFKPEILEEAQALDIPVILHLPKMITQCQEDLKGVITDFPKLRIVLAHLGLPHLPIPGLEEAYREFGDNPNLFMDTAMIPSKEVVGMALRTFGPDRIMFGSDEPLYLVRAVVYENPKLGQRLATSEGYHWADPQEQKEFADFAQDAVHMHWSALSAIKEATDELQHEVRDEVREKIFFRNAREVFDFD